MNATPLPRKTLCPSKRTLLAATISLSGLLLSPLGHAEVDAPAGALELGAISIEDSAIDDATEQLGYTVRGTTSSTGMALTPRQTPQSVTTITRQQMTDRGISNVEQALDVTPGVTASKYEVGGRTEIGRAHV